MFSYPNEVKTVQIAAPQIGVPGAVTSDIVCLKNVHKAWIEVNFNPVGGAALALIPQRCSNVAAADAGVLVTAVPIWVNDDTVTSDALVRQADAVNYTTTADANPKKVIFEIDPAELGLTALGVPLDCIRLVTGALPNTDMIQINVVCQMRYQSCPPPTVLTN
jgi:hypothetical protein